MVIPSNRTKYASTKEFSLISGLSISRLYALWQKGEGPPRVQRKAVRWRKEPAVLIPLEAGMAWLRTRERRLTDGERRTKLKKQLQGAQKATLNLRAKQAAERAVGMAV